MYFWRSEIFDNSGKQVISVLCSTTCAEKASLCIWLRFNPIKLVSAQTHSKLAFKILNRRICCFRSKTKYLYEIHRIKLGWWWSLTMQCQIRCVAGYKSGKIRYNRKTFSPFWISPRWAFFQWYFHILMFSVVIASMWVESKIKRATKIVRTTIYI